MPAKRVVGAVLVAIGLLMLAYQGFSYTTRDTVIDAGAIEVTREDRDYVRLPPLLGAGAVVVGLVLLVLPARRA
jgi:hypothetical protein